MCGWSMFFRSGKPDLITWIRSCKVWSFAVSSLTMSHVMARMLSKLLDVIAERWYSMSFCFWDWVWLQSKLDSLDVSSSCESTGWREVASEKQFSFPGRCWTVIATSVYAASGGIDVGLRLRPTFYPQTTWVKACDQWRQQVCRSLAWSISSAPGIMLLQEPHLQRVRSASMLVWRSEIQPKWFSIHCYSMLVQVQCFWDSKNPVPGWRHVGNDGSKISTPCLIAQMTASLDSENALSSSSVQLNFILELSSGLNGAMMSASLL